MGYAEYNVSTTRVGRSHKRYDGKQPDIMILPEDKSAKKLFENCFSCNVIYYFSNALLLKLFFPNKSMYQVLLQCHGVLMIAPICLRVLKITALFAGTLIQPRSVNLLLAF